MLTVALYTRALHSCTLFTTARTLHFTLHNAHCLITHMQCKPHWTVYGASPLQWWTFCSVQCSVQYIVCTLLTVGAARTLHWWSQDSWEDKVGCFCPRQQASVSDFQNFDKILHFFSITNAPIFRVSENAQHLIQTMVFSMKTTGEKLLHIVTLSQNVIHCHTPLERIGDGAAEYPDKI